MSMVLQAGAAPSPTPVAWQVDDEITVRRPTGAGPITILKDSATVVDVLGEGDSLNLLEAETVCLKCVGPDAWDVV